MAVATTKTQKETVVLKDRMNEVLKYKDLISKSQKQLEAEELDLKVQIAQSDLQVTVATTKKDLASAKRSLIAAQSAVPYNVQDEFDAYQQVQGLESALAFAERILAERF